MNALWEYSGVSHIIVASGNYTLTSELQITRSMTIEAASAGTAVLNANVAPGKYRRVLRINPSASDVVHIIGLVIDGGFAKTK